MEANVMTLDQLPLNATGKIVDLALSGLLRRRLFDLGFIPGALLRRRYTAPSGSPIAYELQGSVIALRRADALRVYVQEVPDLWTT